MLKRQVKVLVVGSEGSMGQRYVSLIRDLGQVALEYDVLNAPQSLEDNLRLADRVVIATPTETHRDMVERTLEVTKVPYLCEKPLSQDPNECSWIIAATRRQKGEGWVVSNWNYVIGAHLQKQKATHITDLSYDYFRPGKKAEGLYWNACQLVFLHPTARIYTNSPEWKVSCNGVPIAYEDFELGYRHMLADFIFGPQNSPYLWNIEKGLEMTQAVIDRIRRER